MDILSIFGIIIGFSAVLGGNFLEGGHLSGLYNAPAALIVIGGTIGAAMIQTSFKAFKEAIFMLSWIFFPPKLNLKETVEKIIHWSQISRREGLLGLETLADTEVDSFARKGLQLLVDGSEPESIRSTLEKELYIIEFRNMMSVKVFDCMGGYAPTIGIIGAVMGLIHVMGNLADPSKLGSGIATAFVATIYGVGLANLFFLPVANKLKFTVQNQSQSRELLIEGIISISEGENPRIVETKLMAYVEETDYEKLNVAIEDE